MAKTRKSITMRVEVTVPIGMTAATARREVRHLIKDGVGWFHNAGDDDGVKVKRVAAMTKGGR